MEGLSQDIIVMAFEKAIQEVSVPGGKFVLVDSEDYYDKAVAFIRDNFTNREPICKSLGVVFDQEQADFWRGALNDNMTPMLIEESTGDIMAIRVIHIERSDSKFDDNTIKNEKWRRCLHFLNGGDVQADFFGRFGVKETPHFLAMAVAGKYQKQGLAGKIFSLAVNIVRYIAQEIPTIKYIKGEASSNWSKKVYERHGFEQIFDDPFDTYKIDGENVLTNTDVHTSMSHYVLKL